MVQHTFVDLVPARAQRHGKKGFLSGFINFVLYFGPQSTVGTESVVGIRLGRETEGSIPRPSHERSLTTRSLRRARMSSNRTQELNS